MTEPPPVLKTWNRIYALVLLNLLLCILLFRLFAKVFA
jgi:hypothetical protein